MSALPLKHVIGARKSSDERTCRVCIASIAMITGITSLLSIKSRALHTTFLISRWMPCSSINTANRPRAGIV